MKNNFQQNKADKKTSAKTKIKLNADLLAKACCVLFALILWFVVVSRATDLEQEMTFYAVPVTITNANVLLDEYGLSIVGDADYITNITVRGSRAKLSKFSGEDISATLDVKNITESGEHDVAVSVTCPPSSGFSVVRQSLESVKLTVDMVSKKTFDIDVNILNANYDADKYALGTPTVSPASVTVTGPQKLLDSISSACVNLDLGNVESTIGFNRPILLLDSNGEEINSTYLALNHVYADGEVPLISIEEAAKITEKTVTLTTSFMHGYYNRENCMVSVFPNKIKIKGSDYVLSKIDSIEVCAIDETVYTESTVFETKLALPAGITLLDDVDSVSVMLTLSDDIYALEINTNNVHFTGKQSDLNASLKKEATLVFRGDKEALDSFKTTNNAYSVTVDLSRIKETGTYKLPCKVSVSSDCKGVWCELSYVYVTIS